MKKILFCLFLYLIPALSQGQKTTPLEDERKKISGRRDTSDVAILIKMGNYFLNQENLDSAKNCFEEALFISEKRNFPQGLCQSYGSMGVLNYRYDKFEVALDYYFKSLSVAEKHKFDKWIAAAFGNITQIYQEQKKYDKALETIGKAEELMKKSVDTFRLASIYLTAAEIYDELGNTEKASLNNEKGLAICDRFLSRPDCPPSISRTLTRNRRWGNHIAGQLLEKRNELSKAILIYEGLASEVKELNVPQENATYEKQLARLYDLKGEYAKSIEHGDRALELMKQDSTPTIFKEAYAVMAHAYEKLGQYDNAYQSLKLYKQWSDSVLNKEQLNIILGLETKYETEKKDLAIVQLNKEKKSQKIIIALSAAAAIIGLGLFAFAIRSRKLQRKLFIKKEELLLKEQEIEINSLHKKMGELEQMALRAQMNPHFIFNSLNSVQHYVMKQDVEGVNRYLGAFAHLIRQTLDNSGKQFISLEEEVKYLETYLSLEQMKSDNRFSYKINVENNIDRAATYIPGMILQPFVENCIKHGMAHKQNNDGHIDIRITKNGRLICEIEDNGVGRQKAGEIKLADVGAEYESKGISITRNRIETMNRLYNTNISVQVEDRMDMEERASGTNIRLEFPPNLE